MARQTIGIGSSANDGTGDTLRSAGSKINSNFNEVYSAMQALNTGRRLIIGLAGDSIAGGFTQTDMNSGIIQYANAINPLDVYVDRRQGAADGSGGYNFGVGGSPSSYLISDWSGNVAAITKLAAKAVKPDVLFVQSIQNDAMTGTSAAAIDTFYNNVTSFATQALALGVGLVVLCPRPPYNGQAGPNVPKNHEYINQRLAAFANVTPGVVFMNYLPDVKENSDANENNGASSVVSWKGTPSTGGYTADGVHFGAMGVRAVAQHVNRILTPYARKAVPKSVGFQGYDAAQYIYNNLLGRNGLMVGTSGQYNGSANTGVAGASTSSLAQRWSLTDGNGITATPSIIMHPDGYPRQRLTLSGTASAAGSINLSIAFYADVAAAPFALEAMLDFTNVVGLTSWELLMFNAFQPTQNVSQVGTLNDKLFLRTLDDLTLSNSGSANKQTNLKLSFAAGATLSGTVDLGRVGGWRVG